MKIYHVSFGGPEERIFIPRIPYGAAKGEDTNTSRICFASSVDNCLSSMPDFSSRLEESKGYMIIYEVDLDYIDPEFVVYPDDVFHKYGVYDAIVYGEHWITKPLYLVGKTCILNNFEADHKVVTTGVEDKVRDYVLSNYGFEVSGLDLSNIDDIVNYTLWDHIDEIAEDLDLMFIRPIKQY